MLTHVDKNGNARMVNVADKESTLRTAVAEGFVVANPNTIERIKNGGLKKGDVLAVSTVAGINGAKHTWEIIPMCHNIPLSGCEIEYDYFDDDKIRVTATVSSFGVTGVEMEALTAVSTTCLSIYDMTKAIDKSIVIDGIKLLSKSGGKSGDYRR